MTRPQRIVFAGTPDFAVPTLDALLDSRHPVVGVYTQPDRPAGRGRQLTASPVKQRACAAGVPVWQPASLRTPAAQAALAALAPDLLVVVAYGLILPPAVLALPRHGCVNVHASLLPRWRGAAPIQRALLAGDTLTGVTLMQMDAGLDTGPMLAYATWPIAPGSTGGELHDVLARLGAELLAAKLDALLAGRLTPVAQDDTSACYAAKLDKAEAELDWTQPAATLERRVRAFNPWPVAQTQLPDGTVLRVWRAEALAAPTTAAPGQVLGSDRDGIEIACGSGRLRLTELQLPGRKPQPAATFINSRPLAGLRLGAST
ncbi:methionyl-tRNA formyltransferase [Plasticicumulans lactativorans]|uniref:Methionyl-tRNA formyltransferase n=1 Tax=Plasticicumulans lactativorans TaxID=1133106 RepID=A0A4R2LAU1_9GAMM|nr:methionyl-tRNA formyltransferase [Plasticicumulans lactativorans]TCO81459.1 methionyl-tRNA formyltransferase [Plasticicumulans lactativorans]